jgi:hypothetical membrane protein
MNYKIVTVARRKAFVTLSGILLFLAGFMILMGIITAEIFHPPGFSTRSSYISELGASIQPGQAAPRPSAEIFNLTMIVAGILIVIAAFMCEIVFKTLLASIPLGIFGIGILGVGIFPGNIIPWHGIFALVIFVSGGLAAITSFRIVRAPLRFIFIGLGIIALVFLIFSRSFIPTLGVGGAERWLFYPLVFWITGLGAYLLGLKANEYGTDTL